MQSRTPEEPRYDLELVGFPGRPAHSAAAALAPPFGISRDEAMRYVEEAPLVVVKGATEPVLLAYVRALHEAGADLRVFSRQGQTWVIPAPARIEAALAAADDSAPFAGEVQLEEGDTVPTWLAAQTTLPEGGLGGGSLDWVPSAESDDLDLPEDEDFVLVQSRPPAPEPPRPAAPSWTHASAPSSRPAQAAPTPPSASSPAERGFSGQYSRVGSKPGKPLSSTRVSDSGDHGSTTVRPLAREGRSDAAGSVARRISGSVPAVPADPGASSTGSRPAVQTGSEGAVPSGSRTAVPSGPQSAVPSGSRPSVQTGSRAAVPTGSRPSVATGSRPAVPSGSRPAAPSGSRPGAVSASASGMGSRPGQRPGKPGASMIPVSGRRRGDDDSDGPVRFYEPPTSEPDDNPWVDRIPTGEVFSQGLVLLRQQREERGETLEDLLRRTADSFSTTPKPQPRKKPR